MECLRHLDVVGDISPALEATEDLAAPGAPAPDDKQPKKLQEASSSATLARLSSSGVWNLLVGQQPEVGPLGLAWADGLSVVGLRPGKRNRARSTNDLLAHGKEGATPATGTANDAFKKGHNRSRSDVNYRTAGYTDNGLPTEDTLKNAIVTHQMEGEKGSSNSCMVLKQAEMEYREGLRGRWSECHAELTPCELRLYTLDSSANRQLGTAYSLSHCQGVVAPAPCQPADTRILQAVFFNSTRVQLRAATQWEAAEWRRLIWEKVLAVRPARQRKVVVEKVVTFPDAATSDGIPPLSRPTTLPLFNQRCQDVLKAGLLHQLLEQNNWCAFTFVLNRTTLQAFPTEGRGPVSRPVRQYLLASCLGVHSDPEAPDQGERFQAVFTDDALRLKADTAAKAREWIEALRGAVGTRRPAWEECGAPLPQGVLLRSRERRQKEQRAKRQSVTTSFLSLLTCVALEKGLTAQGFTCAGCQRPVGASRGKAKVCHYSGWYYCQSCHQDNTFVIPARLLHNWDTCKHKVSKQAKEFLEFVYEEPLLDVQQLNGGLYEHCEPLSAVLRLRQQLQSLRAYLFSCRATIAEDLRRRIFPREYLLQHIHLYSIADLQQVIDGQLAPFLSKVIKFASAHVLACTLCRQKGFICELCHSQSLIYPFQDSATARCSGCGAVFHAECRQKCQPCPRCVRRELHHAKRPSSFCSPDDDRHLPYHHA
ncbi:pleckstrin homology domain-containing family M member 3 [Phycodurus eques]|uniref:pleckstrin homology domain-containing family M member 3 n=1 Tax=Phycodurus eques TaxID=693459 RepID=UPI002ACE7EC8|nr:pleckstrin homology domain-containing family M member 3 [Phycodurus eques]XP_061548918.1 pleckstrin homology domain-containing family M member 3 [Phycodurus eques]XP_061548919.1 pleckstrin homology domain-containing family M member 3 [Phycodurus eques]XP_061548920.1 pleckstrin homology domain-containing family M member 3 [Phycodurus eques]